MSEKSRAKALSPKRASPPLQAPLESTDDPTTPMHEPGPMIAMQRKRLKWSLTKLAEKSNVSISTISRIENGLISPTYAVLARLCEALEIRWADMLGTEEQRFAKGCRVVNRAGSGVMHNTARGVYEWLGADLATKSMEPTIVEAIPDTGLRKLEGHEGEEFLLVLEGSIVFFMQDYAPLPMNKGDSVYFDASMPHAYYGVTQPARFLSIVSRTRS
jgi:transcriptional regulator with XRE-family HTH domain